MNTMELRDFNVLIDYVKYACPSENKEYLIGYINALIDYKIISLEQHNRLEESIVEKFK